MFNKYFCLVLGVLKSKISKKSLEGFLRKLDFKLFHYKARVPSILFSFQSGKKADKFQCTGRFRAHFQATDFAAPMVVTVWSSVDKFQALTVRLAARVFYQGQVG